MAAVGWVTPCLGHVARQGWCYQKGWCQTRTGKLGAASYLRFIQLTLAPPERPYRSIKLLYLFLAHPHPVGDFLERYPAVASCFLQKKIKILKLKHFLIKNLFKPNGTWRIWKKNIFQKRNYCLCINSLLFYFKKGIPLAQLSLVFYCLPCLQR